MRPLTIVPITFRMACEFVDQYHRHNGSPPGTKFVIGVVDEEKKLRGVAMVGRPIARALDDGFTAEVNRTCTDGCKNANSFLYAAAWRVCREMGYRRLITYTQAGEPGTSLRAAGWRIIAERAPRKNWANSSTALQHLRDFSQPEGVQRTLWSASAKPWHEAQDIFRRRKTRRELEAEREAEWQERVAGPALGMDDEGRE